MQRYPRQFLVTTCISACCLALCCDATRAQSALDTTATQVREVSKKSASTEAYTPSSSEDIRSASAREITQKCNTFVDKAQQLIAQANETTAKTNRLNGTANRYGTTLVPIIKPLKGARLAAARQMYKTDLEQFANHVSEYREHNANVRRQFGECAASRAAYEKNKNSYLIHCKEFHMEDLPPPHVCVTMEQAMGNADSAAGKLKDSVKRLVDSQIELMKTEGRLQAAMLNSANVDKDVRKQHALNLQEQDLAVEFAKIQEEHKQLEVEKRTLSASGVKTPISSVRATIRRK